jgi:hypothetical protein
LETLTYQTAPVVTLATNKFINVPIVLQFDDIPLISIIKQQFLGYTTSIPIYHPDGTYLAKVNGTRVFPTKDGEKAGIVMEHPAHMTVCKMGTQTLFEIYHESGDAFRTNAELYTPTGYFVKTIDAPIPQVIMKTGEPLKIGGFTMSNNTIQGLKIGLWLKSDGSLSIGAGGPGNIAEEITKRDVRPDKDIHGNPIPPETWKKLGPNQPCPCGSTHPDGRPKKYKHCHGSRKD